MKKWVSLLIAAVMAIAAVSAFAGEPEPEVLGKINGQEFVFSSGAGAWCTSLTFEENGAFTGYFHDSEMGETGEGYPDGSVYGCTFHGQISDVKSVDEYTWTAGITVEQDEGQVPEAIEDGIRFVTSAPYGLEKARTITLFVPGTPVERLPEGFMVWSHLWETDPDATEIPYYAFWSEADEAGFITGPAGETPEPSV